MNLRILPLVTALSVAAAAADPVKENYLDDAIHAYEPVYALVEPDPLNAKFQLSLCFQLLGRRDDHPGDGSDRPDGLYLSYSQTSFWDLESDSKPFFDNSYRPEAWFHLGGFEHRNLLGAHRHDLEAGFGHESNGRSSTDSRSLNRVFLRPITTWDLGDSWQLTLAPRIYAYIGNMSDNPDLPVYRGFAELLATIGRRDGIQLSAVGHIGRGGHYGSIQVDVTYPLDHLTGGLTNCYAQVQWFSGYAESLINYRQHGDRMLIGIAIVR